MLLVETFERCIIKKWYPNKRAVLCKSTKMRHDKKTYKECQQRVVMLCPSVPVHYLTPLLDHWMHHT